MRRKQQPANEPQQPANEPQQPSNEPQQPANEPQQPVNEPQQPSNEPAKAAKPARAPKASKASKAAKSATEPKPKPSQPKRQQPSQKASVQPSDEPVAPKQPEGEAEPSSGRGSSGGRSAWRSLHPSYYSSVTKQMMPGHDPKLFMAELEREGLVHSQRTAGRFVTEDRARIQQAKRQCAEEQIQTFLEKMEQLGYTRAEILQLMEQQGKGDG